VKERAVSGEFLGIRILVAAGPTHEPIDDVRFIGNRSSGRVGVAIAQAAERAGAEVTLLLGPVCIDPVGTARTVRRFRTSAELDTLLHQEEASADLIIMAAAVADFRPSNTEPGKLRRSADGTSIALEPVPDLLAGMSQRLGPVGQRHATIIGFALEPAETLRTSAQSKLERKSLDAIVANPLGTMEAATISATLFTRQDDTVAEMAAPQGIDKADFAIWLLTQLRSRGLVGHTDA